MNGDAVLSLLKTTKIYLDGRKKAKKSLSQDCQYMVKI